MNSQEEICNEISAILTRLGYDAPKIGDLYHTVYQKLLVALVDIEKRINKNEQN